MFVKTVLARDAEGVLLFAADAKATSWTLHVDQAHTFAQGVATALHAGSGLSVAGAVVPLFFALRHLHHPAGDCGPLLDRLPMVLRRRVAPCVHGAPKESLLLEARMPAPVPYDQARR